MVSPGGPWRASRTKRVTRSRGLTLASGDGPRCAGEGRALRMQWRGTGTDAAMRTPDRFSLLATTSDEVLLLKNPALFRAWVLLTVFRPDLTNRTTELRIGRREASRDLAGRKPPVRGADKLILPPRKACSIRDTLADPLCFGRVRPPRNAPGLPGRSIGARGFFDAAGSGASVRRRFVREGGC